MNINEQNFSPSSASGSPDPNSSTPDKQPWWHRPWVWAILGALLVLLGYFIGSCGRETRSSNMDAEQQGTRQDELLLKAQQGVNDGLQAEIDRLRGLLAGDVCASAPYEPLYGKPLPPDTMPGQAVPPPEGMELPADPGGPENYSVPPTNATIEPLAVPADLQKPDTLAALAEQATVMVLSVTADSGQVGTGFFYAPGLILTNAHVVNQYKELYIINKTLGKLVPGKVVACGKNSDEDFAVIKLDDPNATKIYPLTFTTKVARTDRVSTWGYPGLIAAADPKFLALIEGDETAVPEIVYSEGVVSMVVDDSPQLIAHTAEISQGNSGGPTIDQNGRVIGINTLIVPDSESNRQANICIGTRDVLSFLARHKSGAVVED